jgi:cation-transporting ATPase E
MLFLTKTTYAITLSVVFGALLLAFPFLPRQLSATDGLTIGIPAFFLALMPNTRRYTRGFLKRALTFAVPAGLIVTAAVVALNIYSVVAGGSTAAATRTASVITLSLVALWILAAISRPLNLQRAAIIGAMYVGLAGLLAVPVFQGFFGLEWPPPTLLAVSLGLSSGGILGVEILARVHGRRYPRE